MKLQALALAVALSAATAGAAYADPPGQATLAHPVSAPLHPVAGGATWACEGSSCATVSEYVAEVMSVWSCKTLVREVGPVVSYSQGGRALPPAALASCNSVAR
jgi:hypothetical protein